jgi:hypothetical protein
LLSCSQTGGRRRCLITGSYGSGRRSFFYLHKSECTPTHKREASACEDTSSSMAEFDVVDLEPDDERLIRLNEQLPATQFRKDECGCLFWGARRNDYRGRLIFGCQRLITGSHFFSVQIIAFVRRQE